MSTYYLHHIHPPTTLSLYPPPPISTNPQTGPDLHSCPPFYFVLWYWGFEPRTSTQSHSTSPFFVNGFFRDRVYELFAQAGFELQFS
jgi:hypothetical protein